MVLPGKRICQTKVPTGFGPSSDPLEPFPASDLSYDAPLARYTAILPPPSPEIANQLQVHDTAPAEAPADILCPDPTVYCPSISFAAELKLDLRIFDSERDLFSQLCAPNISLGVEIDRPTAKTLPWIHLLTGMFTSPAGPTVLRSDGYRWIILGKASRTLPETSSVPIRAWFYPPGAGRLHNEVLMYVALTTPWDQPPWRRSQRRRFHRQAIARRSRARRTTTIQLLDVRIVRPTHRVYYHVPQPNFGRILPPYIHKKHLASMHSKK